VREHPRDGGNVDDVRGPRGLEQRKERAHAPDAAEVDRVDDLLDLLGVEVEEAPSPGEACVVDEKLHSRMPFSDPGRDIVDLRAVGDVADLRLSAEFGRDSVELRGSAG
jgi:hypothetical protein